MSETTLLYTLSTLAQTCAALAAFVGAVGVFRLQILREQRREVDQIGRLRIYTIPLQGGGWDGTPAGFGPYIGPAEDVEQEIQRLEGLDPKHPAVEPHRQWKAFERPIRSSRVALIVFEVWNVGLIAASLIGFNYVRAWVGAGWVSCALWAVAAGTAGVTLSCVCVWTRGVQQ